MSTDWFFNFDKKRFNTIDKKIKQLSSYYKTEKQSEGSYCIVEKKNGNGSWIFLSKESGTGTITRYAGTSPENLSAGFRILADIVKAQSLICEYDMEEL